MRIQSPTVAPVADGRRARPPVAERSLAQILALDDGWKFVGETIGLLGLIWLWQRGFAIAPIEQGSMPHPYWVPVLLMSAQYGIMGGLFASLAATAVVFADGLPAQSAAEDFYDHAAHVATQPFAWFAAALVLGGLRTLHRHHQAALQERLDHTTKLAGTLAKGLEQAVDQLCRLERRIVMDGATVGALLGSLAKLELTDRPALLRSTLEAIQYGVGATSFAIYLRGPGGLEPCVGLADGVSVGMAALPVLPAELRDRCQRGGTDQHPAARQAADDDAVAAPIWAPILPAEGEPVGMIVCTRLNPAQDRRAATRRLGEIGRVLAALLPACPEPPTRAVRP